MFTWGHVIRLCRQMARLTQQELAERCYLTQGQIAKYESDTILPRIDNLEIILDACGYELGIREKNQKFTADEVANLIRVLKECEK